MELASDFSEFCASLNENHVEYLVVGATPWRCTARVIQMGVPPVQIHIISDISGIGWEDAWAGRETGRLGDLEIASLGLDGLLTNKRASGRTKDLADVEALTQRDRQDS